VDEFQARAPPCKPTLPPISLPPTNLPYPIRVPDAAAAFPRARSVRVGPQRRRGARPHSALSAVSVQAMILGACVRVRGGGGQAPRLRRLSVLTEGVAKGSRRGFPHAALAGRAAQVHYTANEKPHIQNDTITINHRFAGAPPARRARQAPYDTCALAQRHALPAHAQGLSLLLRRGGPIPREALPRIGRVRRALRRPARPRAQATT